MQKKIALNFAKRPGPSEKSPNLFAKGNGPNGKNAPKRPGPNGTFPIRKKEKKNDKIIEKLRQKRMAISTSMLSINNRPSMAGTKNARLYVRNNNTCTNTRK